MEVSYLTGREWHILTLKILLIASVIATVASFW